MPPQKHPSQPSDSLYGEWLRYLPASWHGFALLARYDRPIGVWLLFLPCLWGLALAARDIQAYPDWQMILLFAVGAIAMRGAGCTLNDLIDHDLDAQVARTSGRPLPSGMVSRHAAWLFLAAQCLVGLVVLLQFNALTIGLGFASLSLVVFYPFAKRLFWCPQCVLGVVFNWGVWLGYTAFANDISLAALALYCAAIFWTIGYDTIYAHQDKEDDALIGVKSTARLWGGATKPALWLCYGATLLCLAIVASLAGLQILFWVGWSIAAWHLAYQIILLDIDDPASCLRQFRSNRDTGAIIAGALFLGIF
ncbi:MAG: 4-hydroxybenzoate octaprenyltransferase [Alphaproteobacteria bacterium]|nr:4-hydroxybenzoate octaprenyltransferase [Alphaproteobacteria bacterium]MBE8220192.1 4-hydroxybenzoate octaprenyltransferase [Alphaproteobacteria bacterium]